MNLFSLCVESIMNIHEDIRAKPSSWSVVAWLPVINEDLSTSPAKGYHIVLPEICEFTMLAGDIFLQDGSKNPNTHGTLCMEMVKQDCLDIMLEPLLETSRCILLCLHIIYYLTYLTYCTYSGTQQDDL